MNIAYYFLTYNRPQIMSKSFQTLCANTNIKPNEIWIIDDGSQPEVKNALFQAHLSSNEVPINLLLHSKNQGIGFSFERCYNLIWQNDDLDIACIIESDYIWRKGWLEDCLSVFEASPYTLAIGGTNHQDYYSKTQQENLFPNIMEEFFQQDISSRQHLFKPFKLNNIEVLGVSNSCGCMIINWKRLKNVIKELEDNNIIPIGEYKKKMDRAFNKGITHDTRLHASDGIMSSIISKYGDLYLNFKDVDTSKNFPMLSICDYSISSHRCAGGVNGKIPGLQEGDTFINSPGWFDGKYLNEYPIRN